MVESLASVVWIFAKTTMNIGRKGEKLSYLIVGARPEPTQPLWNMVVDLGWVNVVVAKDVDVVILAIKCLTETTNS